MDTIITLLDKELADKKLIEVFDPIHGIRYWYAKVKSAREFDTLLVKIIPNANKLVDPTPSDEEEQSDGECVELMLENHLVIIFWANLKSIDSLSHECLHAVLHAANNRGISTSGDGNEALCYMFGFLMDEVCKKLKLKLIKGK